jgi:hypothetical protein
MELIRKVGIRLTRKVKDESLKLIPVKELTDAHHQLFGDYGVKEETEGTNHQLLLDQSINKVPVKLTSNIASDRHLSLVALGFSNGLIKLTKS